VDNTLNQFRRRLAQINGINLNEVSAKPQNHNQALSDLWHKHAEHTYKAAKARNYPASDAVAAARGTKTENAASNIEKHVEKHYGSQVANDMKRHSNFLSTYWVSRKNHDQASQLRKKHNIIDTMTR